jgi:hypothetical protein
MRWPKVNPWWAQFTRVMQHCTRCARCNTHSRTAYAQRTCAGFVQDSARRFSSICRARYVRAPHANVRVHLYLTRTMRTTEGVTFGRICTISEINCIIPGGVYNCLNSLSSPSAVPVELIGAEFGAAALAQGESIWQFGYLDKIGKPRTNSYERYSSPWQRFHVLI